MINGELRSKMDRIWDDFWSGGISNPLSVIEQITYLLFIKRLDEIHTNRELSATMNGTAIEKPGRKNWDRREGTVRGQAGRNLEGRRPKY